MANILKKFLNDFEDITEYYNFLVEKTKNHGSARFSHKSVVLFSTVPFFLPLREKYLRSQCCQITLQRDR